MDHDPASVSESLGPHIEVASGNGSQWPPIVATSVSGSAAVAEATATPSAGTVDAREAELAAHAGASDAKRVSVRRVGISGRRAAVIAAVVAVIAGGASSELPL